MGNQLICDHLFFSIIICSGGKVGYTEVTGCCPKFTFPTFTPDPNLHTPHIYTGPKFTQTQIYTRPKFTQTQMYTNPFLDIYFNKPKFTQPKFTQNPNLYNPNF